MRSSRSEVGDFWMVVCGEHSDGANVNCGEWVTPLDALTILHAAVGRVEIG